jgi:RimJ/RimL family protein N-acetyltransferase
MTKNDFEPLYAAASDPLIWAQHPSPNRYQQPVFEQWFAAAMESKGALVAVDNGNEKIVGSSRYYDWNPVNREVAIGFTFLSRTYWGGAANAEMKKLMIEHAFQQAEIIWFHVGPNNIRSQKALDKIGAKFSHRSHKELSGKLNDYFFYAIRRTDFIAANPAST